MILPKYWLDTHMEFSINDVNDTAQYYDEIKDIPRIAEVVLRA